MKKIYALFALPALMLAACNDDIKPDTPEVVPGEDIVFKASLPQGTRTVYGEFTGDGRKVMWVNGDRVNVFSPQCEAGFQRAVYEVKVAGNQSFADELVKTETTGLRWGTSDATATKFYAGYPEATFSETEHGVDATFHIDGVQEANMSSTKIGENTKWAVAQDSPIPNNIMYAQPIAGQNQVTTDANGKTVANLQFTPYATTLHMTFAGWERVNSDLTANMTELIVFSVTVTAHGTSRDITGDFTLSLNADGSAPTTSNSQASIEGNKSAQVKLGTENMNGIPLKEKDTFECDLFLIPNEGSSITGDWDLTLETSSGNYTRKLTPSGNSELLPGQIHKMEFPAINVKNDWVYTPNSWLADINDNVYWSEVSLPGSWYSASNTRNDLYQDGTIAQQFAAGVRAFHLETKVGWTAAIGVESDRLGTYKNVVISGSGDNGALSGNYRNATAIASTVNEIASQL